MHNVGQLKCTIALFRLRDPHFLAKPVVPLTSKLSVQQKQSSSGLVIARRTALSFVIRSPDCPAAKLWMHCCDSAEPAQSPLKQARELASVCKPGIPPASYKLKGWGPVRVLVRVIGLCVYILAKPQYSVPQCTITNGSA